MLNSLSGEITGRGPNLIHISTSGVEWELEVSGFTLRELAHETHARVFTYLHHREDQMRLYGFSGPEERRVFLELTRVSGIGPRAAIRILSSTSPRQLIKHLESEDLDALVALPGLGTKTAQKIILALRGKLIRGEPGQSSQFGELIEGLVEMGFDRSRATAVVTEIAADLAEPTEAGAKGGEDEIFRRAIVRLSEA